MLPGGPVPGRIACKFRDAADAAASLRKIQPPEVDAIILVTTGIFTFSAAYACFLNAIMNRF
jgi:hypothetical protein